MVAMGKHKLIVTRSFAGLVLLGFGIFNAYDGIVDHLILAIHHAIDMPAPLLGDLIWLATLGFAFIAAGAYLIKQKQSMAESNASAEIAAAALDTEQEFVKSTNLKMRM